MVEETQSHYHRTNFKFPLKLLLFLVTYACAGQNTHWWRKLIIITELISNFQQQPVSATLARFGISFLDLIDGLWHVSEHVGRSIKKISQLTFNFLGEGTHSTVK